MDKPVPTKRTGGEKMKCIDFDGHFAEYTSQWMKEHSREYKTLNDMEADMPKVYLRFLNTPASWLDGSTPGAYFGQFHDPSVLVAWLREYCVKRVPLPDPLQERILDMKENCVPELMALLADQAAPQEAMMTAVGLLREMDSAAPMELYISWQQNRREKDELCDNALESLMDMGREAVPAMLAALPQCNRAGQEALLDVLSAYPGHEPVFQLALKFFTEDKKRRALFAGYLGRLGDERALPSLLKVAGEQNLPYLDFIEVRNAIERLGGDAPNREFHDDPGYDAMIKMQ
jgi:hypothetical protein